MTRKTFLSAALVVLSAAGACAGPVWHFGTYEGVENRIWYGDDETGEVTWVFDGTPGPGFSVLVR